MTAKNAKEGTGIYEFLSFRGIDYFNPHPEQGGIYAIRPPYDWIGYRHNPYTIIGNGYRHDTHFCFNAPWGVVKADQRELITSRDGPRDGHRLIINCSFNGRPNSPPFAAADDDSRRFTSQIAFMPYPGSYGAALRRYIILPPSGVQGIGALSIWDESNLYFPIGDGEIGKLLKEFLDRFGIPMSPYLSRYLLSKLKRRGVLELARGQAVTDHQQNPNYRVSIFIPKNPDGNNYAKIFDLKPPPEQMDELLNLIYQRTGVGSHYVGKFNEAYLNLTFPNARNTRNNRDNLIPYRLWINNANDGLPLDVGKNLMDGDLMIPAGVDLI